MCKKYNSQSQKCGWLVSCYAMIDGKSEIYEISEDVMQEETEDTTVEVTITEE